MAFFFLMFLAATSVGFACTKGPGTGRIIAFRRIINRIFFSSFELYSGEHTFNAQLTTFMFSYIRGRTKDSKF